MKSQNDSAGQRASKRSSASLTNKKASVSSPEPCSDPIVGSLNSLDKDDEEEIGTCVGYDEFGMTIPWVDHIGGTSEALGRGRSGDVTKVVWNAQPVALKTFVLQFYDRKFVGYRYLYLK